MCWLPQRGRRGCEIYLGQSDYVSTLVPRFSRLGGVAAPWSIRLHPVDVPASCLLQRLQETRRTAMIRHRKDKLFLPGKCQSNFLKFPLVARATACWQQTGTRRTLLWCHMVQSRETGTPFLLYFRVAVVVVDKTDFVNFKGTKYYLFELSFSWNSLQTSPQM